MRNLLLGFVLLILALPVFASDPSYSGVQEAVETEAEEGAQEDTDTIQLSRDVLIFPSDATGGDLQAGFDGGNLNTARSQAEGSQVNLQAQMRQDMAEWHRSKFQELREFRSDLSFAANEATKFADEDPGNGDFDVVHQLTEFDKMLHGPVTASGPGARESDPMFAKASSTSLNSAPHAASQQGDPCQDGGGNSAGLGMGAMGSVYPNACDGQSYAEILDCTKETIKRINSEAKGASCNSTQVMQPTTEPDRAKLQNVSQAGNNSIDFPSCPTSPREAETVMANLEGMISADRGAFEQNSLTAGRSTTALVYQPTKTVVKVPWYGKIVALIWPSSYARLDATGNFRDQSTATVLEGEINRQNFAKFLVDLSSHSEMAAAQDWANKSSQMMEELNKSMRANLQETEKMQEHWQEIAELNMKPF